MVVMSMSMKMAMILVQQFNNFNFASTCTYLFNSLLPSLHTSIGRRNLLTSAHLHSLTFWVLNLCALCECSLIELSFHQSINQSIHIIIRITGWWWWRRSCVWLIEVGEVGWEDREWSWPQSFYRKNNFAEVGLINKGICIYK
jgi:hypothetical protein